MVEQGTLTNTAQRWDTSARQPNRKDTGLAQDAALLAWVALQSMGAAGLAQDTAVLAWVAPRTIAAAGLRSCLSQVLKRTAPESS